MRLAELVQTHAALRRTRSRKEKIALLAARLREVPAAQVAHAVAWLTGGLRQGPLGIGWKLVARVREAMEPARESRLELAGIVAVLDEIAELSGPGSARAKQESLAGLLRRATSDEQEFLTRLLLGEMRQGASAGLLVEAIALAADVPADAVRRAHMVSADLGAVAQAAIAGGEAELARFGLALFRPVLPMLASPAGDFDDVFARHERAAFEWKLDGARVQVHVGDGDVRVYSRRMNDVTAAVPELVEAARSLPLRSAILDGETLALRPDGTPHPFQVTMRRFGRRQGVDALRASLPLATFFFDALHLDGEDLLDAPTAERAARLGAAVPQGLRVPRLVTGDAEEASTFWDDALARGHEGLMAKGEDAPYEAGGRGFAWLKLKPAHTLDLVVLAAEWGSGRRRGWLSNLHLGARDPAAGGFVMLGKTFKGLTDKLLAWQTRELLAREVAREDHVVHVRPELVVEIAFSGVQTSPHYPGGLALRFARVRHYRPDRAAEDADSVEAVRAFLPRG